MHDEAGTLETLDRVGGHPALDFVNTVHSWTGSVPGEEYLHDYEEVLRWHRLVGLLGAQGMRALQDGSTRAKTAALQSVLDFRDSLHALFHAVAAREPLPQASLDDVNEVIRSTVNWRRLVASGNEISCGWDFTGAPPAAVIGPVAWQAVELLEHGEIDRIKECPFAEGCGWLFLDSSKNRSRTWCSMRTCGNTAKVKRFRARRGR